MRSLNKFSLRGKLTAIVMITCSAAILVVCAIFAIYDVTTFKRSLASDLVTTAEITGSNLTAALTFGDRSAASETLSSLSLQKHITEACVYNKNGTTLAEYSRGSNKFLSPPAPRADQTLVSSGYLMVFRQVRLDGEVIGSIYVRSDLLALRAREMRFSIIIFHRRASISRDFIPPCVKSAEINL